MPVKSHQHHSVIVSETLTNVEEGIDCTNPSRSPSVILGVIGDSCRNNTSPGRDYDGSLPEQKSSSADVGTDASRVSRLVHDFLRILVVGQSGQLNICWFRPYTTPNPESRLVWVRVLHNNASTPCFLVNF